MPQSCKTGCCLPDVTFFLLEAATTIVVVVVVVAVAVAVAVAVVVVIIQSVYFYISVNQFCFRRQKSECILT